MHPKKSKKGGNTSHTHTHKQANWKGEKNMNKKNTKQCKKGKNAQHKCTHTHTNAHTHTHTKWHTQKLLLKIP